MGYGAPNDNIDPSRPRSAETTPLSLPGDMKVLAHKKPQEVDGDRPVGGRGRLTAAAGGPGYTQVVKPPDNLVSFY